MHVTNKRERSITLGLETVNSSTIVNFFEEGGLSEWACFLVFFKVAVVKNDGTCLGKKLECNQS